MMLADRLRLASSLAMVLLACSSACSPPGVTVPDGYQDLKPCNFRNPIKVEDLSKIGRPGCDMVGTPIQFPDGRELVVAPVGHAKGSVGSFSTEAFLTNWGVPGVGAAIANKQRLHGIWGTSAEAIALERKGLALSKLPTEVRSPS